MSDNEESGLAGGDTFSEVTTMSWGGRIKESLKGVVIGALLFILSFSLLSWNEERAADRSATLRDGAAAVVSVSADRVDRANQGKLVHVTGQTATDEQLTDSEFNIRVNAIKLIRNVEIYQWREDSTSETREKLGGGSETVTKYTYSKGWDSGLVSSSGFRKPEGHANPDSVPFFSETFQARHVTLGAFRLSKTLVDQLSAETPLELRKFLSDPPSSLGGRPAIATGNQIYLGSDPSHPQVGDLRVSFSVVGTGDVSIVSQQDGDHFIPYATPTGDIQLIENGQLSAPAMFREANSDNSLMTWGLRLTGFLMMFMGLRLILGIVEVIASVIPLLGWIVDFGLGIVSLAIALVLSLLTIGTAWIGQHPVAGLLVAAIAVAAAVAARKFRKGSGTTAKTGSPPPPPPPPPPPQPTRR